MPASPSPVRARSRAPFWRTAASFAVIGLALLAALSISPRLGLDLKGGTQIVLETKDSARVKADRESTNRALEVLRGRIDALGVTEPTLALVGERRILIELPGLQDPREATDVIGRTAQLSFHVVQGPSQPGTPPPAGTTAVPDEDGQPVLVGPAVLDGNGVKDADAERPPDGLGSWVVSVAFNGSGAPEWRELVSGACENTAGGRRIAIMLDDEVISSPTVQPELVRRRWHGHPDHRSVHAAECRRPCNPDQRRRAAGAGGGDRATHGRRHPRRCCHRRVCRGRHHRHRLDRAVHRRCVPAHGADGDGGPGHVRADLVRPPGVVGGNPHPARPGRFRARHRARDRRQRAGLRTRTGGVRRTAGCGTGFRARYRIPKGLVGDPRLQHHHAARGRTPVLLRVRAGQGVRRHAVDRRGRLDDLSTRRCPRAHRLGGASSVHLAMDVRPRWLGKAARLAGRARTFADASRGHLDRRRRGGRRVRDRWHCRPRPQPRRGVHRRPTTGVLDQSAGRGGTGSNGGRRRRLRRRGRPDLFGEGRHRGHHHPNRPDQQRRRRTRSRSRWLVPQEP